MEAERGCNRVPSRSWPCNSARPSQDARGRLVGSRSENLLPLLRARGRPSHLLRLDRYACAPRSPTLPFRHANCGGYSSGHPHQPAPTRVTHSGHASEQHRARPSKNQRVRRAHQSAHPSRTPLRESRPRSLNRLISWLPQFHAQPHFASFSIGQHRILSDAILHRGGLPHRCVREASHACHGQPSAHPRALGTWSCQAWRPK